MTPEIFDDQLSRLRRRFGEKAFDFEMVKLIMREVSAMPNDAFIRLVDTMIGTRPHTRPPVLTDFREMRLQSEKSNLSRQVHHVSHAINASPTDGLKRILDIEYPGCNTVIEAMQLIKLKNKIKTALGED